MVWAREESHKRGAGTLGDLKRFCADMSQTPCSVFSNLIRHYRTHYRIALHFTHLFQRSAKNFRANFRIYSYNELVQWWRCAARVCISSSVEQRAHLKVFASLDLLTDDEHFFLSVNTLGQFFIPNLSLFGQFLFQIWNNEHLKYATSTTTDSLKKKSGEKILKIKHLKEAIGQKPAN